MLGRRAHLLGFAGLLGASPLWAEAGQRKLSPRRHVHSVGPGRAIKHIADAAKLARDGDLVQVDAGDYVGDVAVWQQDDLVLQAVGGRVRLHASGAAAEAKAIWVLRSARISVQGFDFYGCAVASGNGAGIRLESGAATVHDCAFIGNEMGLLTNNDARTTLDITGSEFAYNFRYGAHNHNLYVGAIARLRINDSYLHHGRTGHLLKSRAAVSELRYNRLTDETSGHASYEVEFPNGGEALLLGNVIAQSADTENDTMIAFGAEGYRWPRNALHLSGNTLIDHRSDPHVACAKVAPGAPVDVRAANNLLVGGGTLFDHRTQADDGNVRMALERFSAATDENFRWRPDARLFESQRALSPAGSLERPMREYLHPRHSRPLTTVAHNPGAVQQ